LGYKGYEKTVEGVFVMKDISDTRQSPRLGGDVILLSILSAAPGSADATRQSNSRFSDVN